MICPSDSFTQVYLVSNNMILDLKTAIINNQILSKVQSVRFKAHYLKVRIYNVCACMCMYLYCTGVVGGVIDEINKREKAKQRDKLGICVCLNS